jgi:stage V sporulation protein B
MLCNLNLLLNFWCVVLSEVKKFISDVGITFLASVVSVFIAFSINVLLGRYLGASDLGLYRMVNTIFGICILFLTFGIPAAVIHYLAEFSGNSKKQQELVSSCIITSLVLGIASALIIYLTSELFAGFFNMPQLSILLKSISFSFPFSLLNTMLLASLNGFREMTKNAWSTIVNSIFTVIITLFLLPIYGVKGAVLAIGISSTFATFFSILIYKFPRISFTNYFYLNKKMISFGSKTLLSNAINLINYQADILMIGYFLSSTELGIYSVSIMFAKVIWILPDSIQKTTFPLISEYYANGMKDPITIVVDRCMKYSCILLVLSSIFILFFGKYIIYYTFGSKFEQAYLSLNILLIGTVVYGITKSVGSIFASVGKINIVYKIPLTSAILNIVLNSLLIPIYKINGAAVATTLSFIISSILTVYFIESLLEIKVDYKWYIKFLFSSGIVVSSYLCLNKLIDPLILGSILILVQIVLSILVIPINDKKKVFQLIGI